MATALLFVALLYLALLVLFVVSYWKIFTKAGKPGWASIVPIYSAIVMMEIIKKPLWWLLMLLIPLVNIYFIVVMVNELSKSFGKTQGFTAGLIFLPVVFYPILAFGDAEYIYDKTDELEEIGVAQEV